MGQIGNLVVNLRLVGKPPRAIRGCFTLVLTRAGKSS